MLLPSVKHQLRSYRENINSMPKASTSSRSAAAARRHNPLADDLTSAGQLRTQSAKKNKRNSQSEEDGHDGERFVDAKMSRKILQIGQELADEDAAERSAAMGETRGKVNSAFDFESRFEDDEPLSDDEEKFAEDQWGEDEIEEVVCSPQLSSEYHFVVDSNDILGG